MAVLALLVSPLVILGFSAVAMALPAGQAGLTTGAGNLGPHGLTDILYAFTSTNGNNGSAFAGLNGNTPFYNWTLGMAMLIGRFAEVIPLLAFGGALVKKRVVPAGLGTFPTTGPLFVGALDRRDPDRGRADLLPGLLAGADRRTPADAGREDLLRCKPI